MTTTVLQCPPSTPDFAAIKARQQATWASGDYSLSARRCLSLPNPSARRLTCAPAEGLTVTFRDGDAECLPAPDASFDAVLSTFGVMFAPDHSQAAREMLRVCRPGGRIGLANWTPEGFIGQLFKTVGKHVPPPAGLKSPALWGTEQRLREIFGDQIAAVKATRKHFVFRYRSAQHWLETFRTYYGPTLKAFAALPADKQDALAADLIALAQQFNSRADTFAAPSEYLEIVLTRR